MSEKSEDTVEEKNELVPVRFQVREILPDQRPFRQTSIHITSEEVFVELLVKPEYVLSSDNGVVLTANGLKNIMDQFGDVFLEVEETSQSNDSWGDEEKAEDDWDSDEESESSWDTNEKEDDWK